MLDQIEPARLWERQRDAPRPEIFDPDPEASASPVVSAATRVLLITSDGPLAATVGRAFSERAMGITIVTQEAQIHSAIRGPGLEAVIIDAALNGVDALDLCRENPRLCPYPVVVLTRRDDASERALALEVGADDAVWRAGPPSELIARVRAIRRRLARTGPSPIGSLAFAGWRFDLGTRRIIAPGGAAGWLSQPDARLLSALLDQGGRVLTRRGIAAVMEARGEQNAAAVDWGVRVYRLRKALRLLEPEGVLIANVRNRGYVIQAAVARAGPLWL